MSVYLSEASGLHEVTMPRLDRSCVLDVREFFPIKRRLSLPQFDSLLEAWYCARRNKPVPRKTALRSKELGQWLGRIAISERDGYEYKIRLFGTMYVKLFGRDLTGKTLSATLNPHSLMAVQEYFEAIGKRPVIGYSNGRVPIGHRRYLAFSTVDLPMSDDIGCPRYFLHGLVVHGSCGSRG